MGLFSTLFGGGKTAETFKREFQAQLRGLGDRRALCWADGEQLEVDLVNRWLSDHEKVELDAVFDAWRQNDEHAVRAAAASVARPGSVSAPGFRSLILEGHSAHMMVDGPTARPLIEGLTATLVFKDDLGDLRPAGEADLRRLQLTAEQAWQAALQPEPMEFREVEPRLFRLTGTDALLAWERQRPPVVNGEPVVLVLGPLTLFTGSQEPVGLSNAARLIQAALAHRGHLTGYALVRHGNGWQRWLPERHDEAARLFFIMLRRCSLRAEYAEQREELGRAQDLFVARYLAKTNQGMTSLSMATWTSGVPSLLPRSEYISLVESFTRQPRLVLFETALARLGNHLRAVEGVYPPLYLAETFPSTEELAALPDDEGEHDHLQWFEDESRPPVEVAAPWGAMTRGQFVPEALEVLAALGHTDAEYVEEAFAVRLPLDEATARALTASNPAAREAGARLIRQIGFNTPFERHRHLDAEARRAALTNYFRHLLSGTAAQPGSRADLLPLLRPERDCWQAALQQQLQFPGLQAVSNPAVMRPLTAGVSISFAFDARNSIRVVQAHDLEALGLSAVGLFELAVQNLEARSPRPLVELHPGVYGSPYRDDYDATRLLLPRLFEGLSLKGRPVAFVPTRCDLIVTGSEDESGLLEAFARVKLAQKGEARLVSLVPLVFGPEGWQPWSPPASSAARAPVEELVDEQLLSDLDSGGVLLRQLWPQSVLATIATRQVADSLRPLVAAILPADTDADVLLPRSDLVMGADQRLQPWVDFARDNAQALTPVEGAQQLWWRYATRAR